MTSTSVHAGSGTKTGLILYVCVCVCVCVWALELMEAQKQMAKLHTSLQRTLLVQPSAMPVGDTLDAILTELLIHEKKVVDGHQQYVKVIEEESISKLKAIRNETDKMRKARHHIARCWITDFCWVLFCARGRILMRDWRHSTVRVHVKVNCSPLPLRSTKRRVLLP